jgi:hypothetical protein
MGYPAQKPVSSSLSKLFGVVGVAVALIVIGLWLTPPVQAKPTFFARVKARYPQVVGSRLDGCLLCHRGGVGGAELNPFAEAFRQNGFDLAAIEDLDSDGDGFTNLEEFQKLTFPGNPNNFPRPTPKPTPQPTPGRCFADHLPSYLVTIQHFLC